MAALFSIVINLAIILLFIRFLLQLAGINRANPVVQASLRATSWLDSLNRTLPVVGNGRINLAALVLLLVLLLLKVWGLNQLGAPVEIFSRNYHELAFSADGLLLGTLMALTDSVLSFCNILVFAAIIMSWVSLLTQGRGVVGEIIQELAEPLFAPFRRLMPNMGMIDLSPLLLILALNIVEILMEKGVAPTVLGGFR